MIFDRMTILKSLFGDRRQARVVVGRWSEACERDHELAGDLVRLGGVLAKGPARFEDGQEMLDPLDPLRLARLEGRRELALELLALMKVSQTELLELMEE